jgi:hypothetical protein
MSCLTDWSSEGSIPAVESDGPMAAEELISVMSVKHCKKSSTIYMCGLMSGYRSLSHQTLTQ